MTLLQPKVNKSPVKLLWSCRCCTSSNWHRGLQGAAKGAGGGCFLPAGLKVKETGGCLDVRWMNAGFVEMGNTFFSFFSQSVFCCLPYQYQAQVLCLDSISTLRKHKRHFAKCQSHKTVKCIYITIELHGETKQNLFFYCIQLHQEAVIPDLQWQVCMW